MKKTLIFKLLLFLFIIISLFYSGILSFNKPCGFRYTKKLGKEWPCSCIGLKSENIDKGVIEYYCTGINLSNNKIIPLLNKNKQYPVTLVTDTVKESSLPNYCNSDEDCIWYDDRQGDLLGVIHCSGKNYAKTCKYCSELPNKIVSNLPETYRCFCNQNGRCQKER